MIFVIVPLGKEAKDVTSWVARVVMYTAASAVGASLLALLLGLVGLELRLALPAFGYQWAVGVLGVGSLLYALHELNILHLPNPELKWQVPRVWMRPGRLVGNIAYGLVLGTGVLTFIPFASFYILLAWEIAAGAVSLQAAVAIGMVYGLARGVPSVLGGLSILLKDQYPIPISQWVLDHKGWWHAINGVALLLVASFLLGSFVV